MALPVKNIVFDFGRVICDFSHEKFTEFLMPYGPRVSTIEDFYAQSQLYPYERGEISTEQFFKNVQSLLEKTVDKAALEQAWMDIFSPFPEMLAFLPELKKNYRIFILSNTSESHWRVIEELLADPALTDDRIGSFQVGAMKPDEKIFRAAEKQFQINPAETVFIDDIAEYARAAESCGWFGIEHRGFESTKARLAELGVLTG